VLNPLAAGSRLVRRTITWQVIAVAALALVLAAKGSTWALAAAVGGAAIIAGGALYGALALGGGIAPAAGALSRLVLGLLAKWFVVIATLAVAIAVVRLPALAVIGGVLVALVAQVLAMAGGHRNGNP
jgi:F0F1-type ATP synthase assembly protein I